MGKHRIFVYGTLKHGWHNNAIIVNQEFISTACTSPDFQMYTLGGYPGVVVGNNRVDGEVWDIDDAAFARCDQLEGHPNFYKREQICVALDEFDELTDAWIYIYQGSVDGLKPIDNWTR